MTETERELKKKKASLTLPEPIPSEPREVAKAIMTPQRMMNLALDLPGDFAPVTSISVVLSQADLDKDKVMTYLRNSSRDEAKAMVKRWELLPAIEKDACTLDHLIASVDMDVQSAVELISGEVYRQGASVAGLLMAIAHPDVMKKTIEFAQTAKGEADRKLFLQSAGSAPVPKTSISNTYVKGNVTNNSQVNIGMPSFEDVISKVDTVLEGV